MTVKMLKDNYIVSVGKLQGTITSQNTVEITEEEKSTLVGLFNSKPVSPEGWDYKLRNSDLVWELVELPPDPDPEVDDAEALDILLGGDGV